MLAGESSVPPPLGISPAPMTIRQIWLDLGGLGVLISLLGLIYWQHTDEAAGGVGITEFIRWTGPAWRV